MAGALPRVTSAPSIHEYIRSRLDAGGRLADSALPLPDEERVMSGGMRWVAGAMDGVLGHHGGRGETAERARAVAEAVSSAASRPTRRNLSRLNDVVSSDDALRYVDPMIGQLVEIQPDRSRLREVARWLATTGSDRGAVKVGIALLGITGLGADVDVVRTLGAHDEFTLFAAVALSNGLPQPDSELWALAAAVDGWGRIHCVERLAGTDDPAIRSWILREGFRNSIMDEYLAYIAATTGRLHDALEADAPDRGLLTAAGEILTALVRGGPAQDMDDYEAGADAVAAYLGHMRTSAETPGDLNAIAAIRSYLQRDRDWDAAGARRWTATRRAAFESACDEIMGRPEWPERIGAGLTSDDPRVFWRAQRAARTLAIDTFDVHVARIRKDPLGRDWYQAWKQADGSRAELLVQLARDLLPLAQVATGPADEVGQGPEWGVHGALGWTLQALRGHVGVGGDLLLVGLQSPVIRNRNMSLMAMKAWPEGAWPSDARGLAEHLSHTDPNQKTRELAAEIVAGAQA